MKARVRQVARKLAQCVEVAKSKRHCYRKGEPWIVDDPQSQEATERCREERGEEVELQPRTWTEVSVGQADYQVALERPVQESVIRAVRVVSPVRLEGYARNWEKRQVLDEVVTHE